MAKIYSNIELSLDKQGEIWSACNGATRRTLVVINEINEQPGVMFRAKLGTLNKGNHSFIFINEEKGTDERVLGIFLNNAYAYRVLEGKELFGTYSSGGYGNSCSRFGIYEVGALLEVNSYKNRNTPSYYRLTEGGWIDVPIYQVNPSEIEDV
jgi:RecA/RadA recombinase